MSRRVGLRTIASIGGKIPVAPPPFAPNPPYVAVPPAYTDTNDWQLPRSNARCTFYAAGRFWIFFREIDEESHVSYVSSADGKEWSSPTRVYTFYAAIVNARFHAAIYSGGYVHLVVCEISTPTSYVYYRRGTISGSTIVWEPWRTVTSSADGDYIEPTITLDDQGYPWISYTFNVPYWYSPGTPYAVRSTALDGSSWDSPYQLTSVSAVEWFTYIGSFGSLRKMYAVYWREGGHMFGRYYDGTNWGDEEDITSENVYLFSENACAYVTTGAVYIAYKPSNTELRFRKRNLTWETETVIDSGAAVGGNIGYSFVMHGDKLYLHGGDADCYTFRYVYENGVWSSKQWPWGEICGPIELFYDAFDDMTRWDSISGTWVIEAGELSGEHTAHGVCVIKDAEWNVNWKNVWLNGFVVRKSPGGGDSGFIFRYKDENNYYRAYIDGQYVGIMKMVNGSPTYPSDWRVPLTTSLDIYYMVDVRIKENIFEVYIDDVYRLTVIDPNPIESGKAGCGVKGEHAHFDDYCVYTWDPWCNAWTHRSALNENVLTVAFQAASLLSGAGDHLILLAWSIL